MILSDVPSLLFQGSISCVSGSSFASNIRRVKCLKVFKSPFLCVKDLDGLNLKRVLLKHLPHVIFASMTVP